MNEETQKPESQVKETQTPMQAETQTDESPYDVYNWEFHKTPILISVVLVVIFYAFVFWWMGL